MSDCYREAFYKLEEEVAGQLRTENATLRRERNELATRIERLEQAMRVAKTQGLAVIACCGSIEVASDVARTHLRILDALLTDQESREEKG